MLTALAIEAHSVTQALSDLVGLALLQYLSVYPQAQARPRARRPPQQSIGRGGPIPPLSPHLVTARVPRGGPKQVLLF